jgi:hypothetical protein
MCHELQENEKDKQLVSQSGNCRLTTVPHNLSTRCVHNRLVASLSTSCNNAVILSSCYKVVTHNLSTRCVHNRLVASLSTSCNNAVITCQQDVFATGL